MAVNLSPTFSPSNRTYSFGTMSVDTLPSGFFNVSDREASSMASTVAVTVSDVARERLDLRHWPPPGRSRRPPTVLPVLVSWSWSFLRRIGRDQHGRLEGDVETIADLDLFQGFAIGDLGGVDLLVGTASA